MKCLVVSIILACFGIVACYSNDPNSPSVFYPWSYKEIVLKQAMSRQKHQTPSVNDLFQCAEDAVEVQCTTDYNQNLIKISTQCRRNDFARYRANQCARDKTGELCTAIFVRSTVEYAKFVAACHGNVASGTGCSDKCRTALQAFQNALGCCSNTLLDFPALEDSSPLVSQVPLILLRPYVALWSLCGVDMGNNCKNIPTFTPGTPVLAVACTDQELLERSLAYQCDQSNVQPILDALNQNGNCQLSNNIFVGMCLQRNSGQYCASLSNQSLSLISSFSSRCTGLFNTSSTCATTCQGVVEDLRNDLGCCANTLITAFRSGYWQSCGVTDPGVCTSPLTAGSSRMEPLVMLVIAMATALLKFMLF